MRAKYICLIMAFLVFLSTAAFGQGQGNGMQNRQRVRENLATLRLLRLTQALDLSEEQAAKIFPTVNKIEKDKLRIQRDMSADIRDLRQLVQNDPTRGEEARLPRRSVGREQAVAQHAVEGRVRRDGVEAPEHEVGVPGDRAAAQGPDRWQSEFERICGRSLRLQRIFRNARKSAQRLAQAAPGRFELRFGGGRGKWNG